MESIIRQESPIGDNKEQFLTQPHVDLAKAWWILEEIIPFFVYGKPSSAISRSIAPPMSEQTRQEYYESCEIVVSNLKALLSSMNRNKVMPPYSALIQGQEQNIWVQYPTYSPEFLPLLSGRSTPLTERAAPYVFNPLSLMAVADTKMEFSYYKWFIKATLYSEDDQRNQVSMGALVFGDETS